MLLATDWPNFAAALPADLIKGGCAISALFDMEPIRLSYLNDTLGMSKEVCERNDPLLQQYPVPTPLMSCSETTNPKSTIVKSSRCRICGAGSAIRSR